MTWIEAAKECALEAERKVIESKTLLGLAEEAYRRKPSKANLISLKAANRLVKEARAQLEEWIP